MTNSGGDFSGLAAVVTGGGSGIGLATVRFLRDRGARVASIDLVHPDPQPEVCELNGDIGSSESVAQSVAKAVGELGGLDIVVNNAGIGALGGLEDNPDEEWQRIWNINVMGMMRVTRAALPHLKASRSGAVVNMASAVAHVGVPNRLLYAATKGAVLSYTRALAAELLPLGVRVNSVSPGVVNTPWQEKAIANDPDPAARRAKLQGFHPDRRFVEAEEVAAAICYLAHPSVKATTGVDLKVDGGMVHLWNPRE